MLNYNKPDYTEQRNNDYLYIWKKPAHWLVVDKEFNFVLNMLDQNQDVESIITDFAVKYNKDIKQAKSEINQAINFLKSKSIIDKGKSGKSKKPGIDIVNINLNITNDCNLSCKWCYNEKIKNSNLDIKHLIKSFTGIKNLISKETSLIVLGGEPLLEKEKLFELLDFTDRFLKNPTLIATNGTLIDKDFARRLYTHNVEIQVSLDGSNESENDKIRGNGNYKKALQGIHNLKKNNVYTILSMVFSKENYNDIEHYLELGLKLGVDEVRFIPMRSIGRGKELKSIIPDLFAVFKYFKNLMKNHPEYKKLLKRDFYTMLYNYCNYSIKYVNCGIGFKYLFVDADGNVYPCPNHKTPAFAVGNINKEKLVDIFTKSRVMCGVRNDYDIENYQSCSKCYVSPWCLGDCRGEVFQNYGDLNKPSLHCGEIKKLITGMFWLISGKDKDIFSDKQNSLKNYY